MCADLQRTCLAPAWVTMGHVARGALQWKKYHFTFRRCSGGIECAPYIIRETCLNVDSLKLLAWVSWQRRFMTQRVHWPTRQQNLPAYAPRT